MGIFGGGSHTTETALAGVQIQTSLLGQVIPIGWGRARLSCNLVDYNGFKAIPHTQKTGGKGGSSTSTTYTYTASPIMVICEGPIIGIPTVYKDSSVFTDGATTALAQTGSATGKGQAGLSLAVGTLTQAPPGFMTSLYPSHALGYSTLAYVYAQDYALGDNASLSNHAFEVNFAIQFGPNGDADPKDVVTDILTNVSYGVTGWTSGLIGDLSDYSLYCRASNLLVSPVIDAAQTGADFLSTLAKVTNSEVFWSEGVLKARSYGDAAVTGNAVTWTPNLTPFYALTEDDFLDEVQLEIVDQSDAYNYVQVEYLDRANQYQPAIAVAQDLDNIVTFGLRKRDAEQFHMICDAAIAQQVVQLRLQRALYIRDKYYFTLPEDFVLVEPMDYLSLTTTVDGMKLDAQLVQVEQIDEQDDGALQITAWGVPGHTGSAALYTNHSGSGYQPDVDADPGNVVSPVIFNAPTSLGATANEVWCAASGGADWGGCFIWISVDNTTYAKVGQIGAPGRYGVLTASLASHADPDTTNTLSVNLTVSGGTLAAATHAEADAGASLCMVGTEILAYADLTLTSAHHYDLSYLRRGQRGSAVAAHSSGDSFIRLDDAVFKYAYDAANVGSTIYIKLQSFNKYGRAAQDISGLSPYTITLNPLVTSDPLPPGYARQLITQSSTIPNSAILTAHDAGSSVTVTLSSHSRVYSDKTVTVTGAATLTGLSYSTLYYFYYDDPNRVGGAVTIHADTNATVAAISDTNPARHSLGWITTPAAAAADTTGGGVVDSSAVIAGIDWYSFGLNF